MLNVNFESDVAKDAFVERLAAVRDFIKPPGAARLDNRQFLTSLFELAGRRVVPAPVQLLLRRKCQELDRSWSMQVSCMLRTIMVAV